MLLQNITRNNQYPYRRSGATATNTETGYMPSQHGLGGPRQFQRFTHFGKASGFPSGYNPGIFMPRIHSEMSSAREAEITFGATATGVLGMPGVGSATFSIDASGVGALIAFGVGTASITISTNTPAMSGTINGSGSASLSITGGGNIGAIASIVGEAGFSFDGSATAYPTDDSSPLRSGTASFSFSGSLVPYAIGHMEGTTDIQTELTADGITTAVLNAVATDFNLPGTIGNKINTASSGGVDLNALAEAVRTELESTTIPVDLKKINAVTVTGTGITSDKWRPA